MSDSDDDLDDTPEMVERRQRAMQLLAKAFNKPSDNVEADAKKAEDEETRFLRSLLSTPTNEIMRCVRDRLSVLSVTRGGVQVASSKPAAPADAPSAAPAPEPAKTALLPELLRRLSDGDVSAVADRILSPDYWSSLVRERVGPEAVSALELVLEAPSPSPAVDLAVPSSELDAMRRSLDARGYGAVQPVGAARAGLEHPGVRPTSLPCGHAASTPP